MNRPILFDYATPKKINDNKIFRYDYSKDMNVLNVDTRKSFIDAGDTLCGLEGKTSARRKMTGKEFNLMELETKTEIDRERDDDEMFFLELISKTYVDRERDDEDDFIIN